MRNTSSLGRSLLLILFAIGILIACACTKNENVSLDIEAGHANYTLKDFAKQAEVEIVYDANSVENVTTNKVCGHMDPEKGLDQMLKGTLLTMEKDPKTGAFAVKKSINE